MHALDWTMICAYFALMIVIGWWSHKRISDVKDFFTAGGRMPWWLAGISHHMSGYSAVLFVAYAGVAYTTGVTVYFWGFASIGIGVGIGSWLFAARWNRLRSKLGVASPLEYLAKRYNVPTQQALAWSGSLLKIFDIAAKWFAVATLLHVFAGLDYNLGILITGAVTLVYCTIGGLWADALTDFGQFVIQAIAAIVMIVVVLGKLGGISALWTMWDKLPEGHVDPVTSKYTTIFLLVYVLVKTLEYNGGMWNLAQRYMAAPNTHEAKRGARLSSALYLLWPLVLMFPMFAAPLLIPGVKDPTQSYAIMTTTFLPPGLIGLVLAGIFSHTMAMVSSDANAISAVITRDMIPAMFRRARQWTDVQGLKAARITTVVFVALTMLVATQAQNLGGVLQIVVNWVAALMGPISIPLLLGMLPWFRKCGPRAALISWAGGLIDYALVYYVFKANQTVLVATPILVSLALYIGLGLLAPERSAAADEIVDTVNTADDDVDRKQEGTTVPA
ncbi:MULTISPECIES: sodium:solute symporter family protein [unclassified Amycolatopsis]|uniref:sodium:solute symporter family protein n=1 Tax=unclassified Amycolatopsis TaxID=2618356 RepID=UPI0028770F02|nr:MULTISPECIES: sodium:solute symporter family protein [unclassified Amycolatopsis]MDS0135594.1 Na+:solute symporter [Amycolatopsis sp. 505]MDS0148390.1 Na+:solute symporter [Amycolatopsis sp. CM201R]